MSRLPLAVTVGLLAACDAAAPEPQLEPVGPMEPAYRSQAPALIDDGNDLSAYVAQCEAVLGPIPEISCDPENPAPGTHVTRIPVFLEGMLFGFGNNPDDAELLAERAATGDYTCDFPSIGGDFACTVGSTLVQYKNPENPNVQWVGLCRGVQRDNPTYDRFIGNGLIGANEKTGEMCFFFAQNPEPEAPYELPRLRSDLGEGDDLGPWLPPRDMPGSCISCHPNNDPWILTPWLQPAYMQSVLTSPEYGLILPEGVEIEDVLAARFVEPTAPAYKTLLPEPLPEGRTGWTEEEIFGEDGELLRRQYRVVGSSYVDAESKGTVKTRTGVAPEGWSIPFRERLRLHTNETNCARGCHAVANAHFENLAADSLGTSKYGSPYLSELMQDETMPGFAWMPPIPGDKSHWAEMFESGEATVPAITECPIPKRVTEEPAYEITCPTGDEPGFVDLHWTYENDYGGVPGRDDVRFDVAFGTHADDHRGLSPDNDVEGARMEAASGDEMLLRDVAPTSERGSAYTVGIPFHPGTETLSIDVQPKRFCFEEPDRRPHAYAVPHRVVVDLAAACG